MKSFNIAFIGLACGAALSFGCSAANDEASTTEQSATVNQSIGTGARCTVRGGVTSGCADGETCKLQACTNSIPPSCFGICQPAPTPSKKCEGAFNCLCGTPVCIDGEWTCQGNCGGDPPAE